MRKYYVTEAADLQPGERKVYKVGGRPVAIFNIKGEYFAILNRCPHQGAELCKGILVGHVTGSRPGEYKLDRPSEIVRCPWHGWEFDIRTGQSWFDPEGTKMKTYPTRIAPGSEYQEGPFKAEVFPVSKEQDYLVVEL